MVRRPTTPKSHCYT